MIYDGGSGGRPEHFAFTVRTLERLGVSAIVIEENPELVKDWALGKIDTIKLNTTDDFCYKIQKGKNAQISEEFMIFARFENIILDQGVEKALQKSKLYLEAGADGIMLHSSDSNCAKTLEFSQNYKEFGADRPLIVLSSAFGQTTEEEFENAGINLIIYANHLLRAAYPAMREAAESILKYGRGYEVEAKCSSIEEILEIIPRKH